MKTEDLTPDDTTRSVAELTAICHELLVGRGLPAADADIAAQVLVRTTARGFRSHGVELLPLYLSWIATGAIRVDATITTTSSSPVSAVIDGGGAMGQVVAMHAVEATIARARSTGMAMVTAFNSNHVGALGHYVLCCAEQGLVALMWSSAPPTIPAPGGHVRVIGNGPTAYALPRPPQPPIVFDAAFSVGSGGKVALARQRGESLPPGWLVDAAGRPSTDPADAPTGAFLPVGGHKGFGLAVLAEVLSTCFSGAIPSPRLAPMAGTPDRPFGLGHTILAVDPAVFGERDEFAKRVVEFGAAVEERDPVGLLAGLPGDGAHAREQSAARDGIVFDAATWAKFSALRENR
jgi:LDH2 family malate/lactate/ureidoglycolate dehydrogenase